MSISSVFGVLRTLERVTRPAGHDLDRPIVDDGEPSITYGYEPGLADDELVGVRELLERFNLAAHSPRAACPAAGDQHPSAAGQFINELALSRFICSALVSDSAVIDDVVVPSHRVARVSNFLARQLINDFRITTTN